MADTITLLPFLLFLSLPFFFLPHPFPSSNPLPSCYKIWPSDLPNTSFSARQILHFLDLVCPSDIPTEFAGPSFVGLYGGYDVVDRPFSFDLVFPLAAPFNFGGSIPCSSRSFDGQICAADPNTGYTESLDKNCEVVVPEDDYGLYAIDILDPSWLMKCMHVDNVYHFHDMIDMLIGCGYNKGTTLFGYGYDFRQSNRIDKAMDGLKLKLATAYKASGGRKVNIISHSMGGLIVKCFASLHKEVFAKYVNKWISIACPFQGAPGCINDALLTGLEFVNGFQSYFFVSRWAMHQLVVECPSVYEMLPNPNFKWKKQPKIHVWRKQTQDKKDSTILVSYGPTENVVLFEKALRDNELKYGSNSIPLPFNFDILKWAIGTRQILDRAKLPDGVSFYSIFGTSFDTPFDVSYGSETSPIEQLPQICHTTPKYSYVDGDGTVPSESAMADGLPAIARVGVGNSHRGLLSDKRVFKLIQLWLGVDDKHSHHSKTSRVIDVCLEQSFVT